MQKQIQISDLNIRTCSDGQQTWYCAKDAYQALNITWSGATIRQIPLAWRTLMSVDTVKGQRQAVFINDKALALLINKSNKPIAMQIDINTLPY